MRPYNFSPGPAALPLEVLEQAREELLDWQRERHVGDGNQPPRQGVHAGRRRGRGGFARAARRAEQLQGAVHAGRRIRAIRHRAAESRRRRTPRRTTSTPGIGRRRRLPKRGATARCAWPAMRGANIGACRRSASFGSTRVPPTCITRRTRRSAASNSATFRTRAACRSSPTCPRASCRGRSMCRSSA